MFAIFFLLIRPPPISTLFPYTTLFRSIPSRHDQPQGEAIQKRQRLSVHRVGNHDFAIARMIDGERLHEVRSEEHTSELQSQSNLVCRLLLEKKKKKNKQQSNNK